MLNIAIAFSTKDRAELSRQSIIPLLQPDKFDLWWIDGSNTLEGQELPEDYNHGMHVVQGIKGGADRAIVYALTEMLKTGYEFIGLVENDVLLHQDWFAPTMQLFERGRAEGLEVGAVSARAYADRVLCQRDGYALMLNLGAGQVIFTRKAVQLILENYRTGWWLDTRAIFNHLTGLDIGRYAAFRGNQQWCSADWHWDAVLAQHGLASLALTPSPVEMIGQVPPLAEQGLALVTSPIEDRRDDKAFASFAMRSQMIREGSWKPDVIRPIHRSSVSANQIYFAHQMPHPTEFSGDWHCTWTAGFGPFSYVAEANAKITTSLFGPVAFLVSGGKTGALCKITDTESGYEIAPTLAPLSEVNGIMQLSVPAGVSYRDITVEMGEGGVFYGIQTAEPQPMGAKTFGFSTLPPVE